VLDWYVAADDRWHTPRLEPAVRQRRVDGTAVVETRVRIPDGDTVQRIWSVPEHGGLTLVEIENVSPLPIAIALSHGAVLSARPLNAPIEGIDVPAEAVAFPIGHHASVTVALPHTRHAPAVLPGPIPPVAGVVRGWTATTERAGRLLLPDETLAERLVAARCELALAGPCDAAEDPWGFVLGIAQLVRMGERADGWVPDLAAAMERGARHDAGDWAVGAALDAAQLVLHRAGEERALRDIERLRGTVAGAGPQAVPAPTEPPDEPGRLLGWIEGLLARRGALLPRGIPESWRGANFEVYGLPTGPVSTVAFAVRWHAARPAVLWEQEGGPIELSAPVVAPAWSSTEPAGEALWPEPDGATGGV
jgi:hypothetical protein